QTTNTRRKPRRSTSRVNCPSAPAPAWMRTAGVIELNESMGAESMDSSRGKTVFQQVAGDHPAVHFARTLDDAHHAAHARNVFERQLLGDAHAAEQLDRTIHHAADHFRALQLDHRAVQTHVPLSAVHLPGHL